MVLTLFLCSKDVVDLSITGHTSNVLMSHSLRIGVVVFGANQVAPWGNAEIVGTGQKAPVTNLESEL